MTATGHGMRFAIWAFSSMATGAAIGVVSYLTMLAVSASFRLVYNAFDPDADQAAVPAWLFLRILPAVACGVGAFATAYRFGSRYKFRTTIFALGLVIAFGLFFWVVTPFFWSHPIIISPILISAWLGAVFGHRRYRSL